MIVSQMGVVTHRPFLLGHCITMDFLVRVLLSVGDWLRACVCVERALTVGKGVGFNPLRSKQTSKVVIGLVYLVTISTALHEPLHRHLIDDAEEQRTWCVTNYSSALDFDQLCHRHSAFPGTLHHQYHLCSAHHSHGSA